MINAGDPRAGAENESVSQKVAGFSGGPKAKVSHFQDFLR